MYSPYRIRLFSLLLLSGSLCAQVTYERLLHSDKEPQNWLTYSGGYASHRFSTLDQINKDNVKNLQLKWVYHPIYMIVPMGNSKFDAGSKLRNPKQAKKKIIRRRWNANPIRPIIAATAIQAIQSQKVP